MEDKTTAPVIIVPMTSGMLPDLAMLHMRGFCGAMNTQLGRRYVYACIKWFFQLEGGIALVAKDHTDGQLGYLVGAPSGYGRRMNRDLLGVASRAIFMRPLLLFSQQFQCAIKQKIAAMCRKSREQEMPVDLPLPIMSLVGLVVDPHVQGQQIGKLLVEAFEAKARDFHMRSLKLSVYPENSAARRVYEKCGWTSCENAINPGKALFYYKIM